VSMNHEATGPAFRYLRTNGTTRNRSPNNDRRARHIRRRCSHGSEGAQRVHSKKAPPFPRVRRGSQTALQLVHALTPVPSVANRSRLWIPGGHGAPDLPLRGHPDRWERAAFWVARAGRRKRRRSGVLLLLLRRAPCRARCSPRIRRPYPRSDGSGCARCRRDETFKRKRPRGFPRGPED
jgi:hypothetical protein